MCRGQYRWWFHKEYLLYEIAYGFSWYLHYFGTDLMTIHHIAALRFLTFTALKLPYTYCNPYKIHHDDYVWPGEDVDEVEEEEVYMLVLLDNLIDEFEGEVLAILYDSSRAIPGLTDFWKGPWLDRMHEVLEVLEGSDVLEGERQGAEELGLIWDG
jgi:hypothetical protein